MKLRLFWWERGLKDEIRVMCSLDPLTHKQYADIEAAQNAACACDAHPFSASAVATAIEPATHTDLRDANFDDESDGDELPATKRAFFFTLFLHFFTLFLHCNTFSMAFFFFFFFWVGETFITKMQ